MALALGNSNHSNDSLSTRGITLTAGSGSVIVVAVTTNGGPVTSITSANGETFTQHATHTANGYTDRQVELWSCVTSSAWTSNSVTVNNTAAGFTTVDVFEITGADTSNIYDDDASIPDVGETSPRTISTDLADTFIIGAYRASIATPSVASGFTLVNSGDYQVVQYKIVSSTQSSLSVPIGSGSTNGGIATAIRIVASVTAAITGTATASITESDIVTGGKTIILTLTGDTWVASGATFDAQRQNIIDGLDSAQSETNGWNAEIRDKEVVGSVVRTSDTVVTITLSASASYDITAQEEITMTIPASALVTSASDVTGDSTFTVDQVSGFQAAWALGSNSVIQGGIQ